MQQFILIWKTVWGETLKCIIECIWNCGPTKYNISYSNNISKAKYIIYFNQCCVHYLCSWSYFNFQHTGNFIISLGIQNLCITFAQALANWAHTETPKSHSETRNATTFSLLLLCLLGWGQTLGEFLPWTATVWNVTACSVLLRPDCHFTARYCTIYIMFFFSMGDGEKSPRIKKIDGGG